MERGLELSVKVGPELVDKKIELDTPHLDLYFMGIGGTGMASVAGLMKTIGHLVEGSDKGIYPPMSDLLKHIDVKAKTPYSAANLEGISKKSIVVVANALSRKHEELEAAINNNFSLTSFPQLMHDVILTHRKPLVITGTHGKTTTTSLAAFVLDQLGVQSGHLIGGQPQDFEFGFRAGAEGAPFAIEGDEYDTVFFDKKPKFHKYCPHWLVINNIEFDHADIFRDLEHILSEFRELVSIVGDPSRIICNTDDAGVRMLLSSTDLYDKVTRIGAIDPTGNPRLLRKSSRVVNGVWQHDLEETASKTIISIQTNSLAGDYNGQNLAMVVGSLLSMRDEGVLSFEFDQAFADMISKFQGVKRRFEKIGEVNGAQVFEDFAHHPTSVRKVIESFKRFHPNNKLHVAFEPVNATGRRRVLIDDFAASLGLADEVHLAPAPQDQRLAPEERMDSKELATKIGSYAKAYENHDSLALGIQNSLSEGDTLIFMSPGSFQGIQKKIFL